MKFLSSVLAVFAFAAVVHAETLPGFRVETLATVSGFVSSVAVDSKNNVYFTTTDGWIHRVDGNATVRVLALPTKAGGNSGLLGMALLDDKTAVVHYTTWSGEKVLDDVIATVDLTDGAEQVMQVFPADVRNRQNGSSSEHHGGNPSVGADGAIYVGIGEYGGRVAAQRPDWNGGKVFRLDRDGTATQFALGLRNPYDLAWDPEMQRVVVGDNGPDGGDEIHVIDLGANCGWPDTYGNQPQIPGGAAPAYVFASTVAPTGIARLTGANDLLRRGYLVGAFVTKSIYYFPDLATRPVPDPIALVSDFDQFVIDVTQSAAGELYFVTAAFPGTTSIHRLIAPERGDCNGDASINYMDVFALMNELAEAPSQPMIDVQNGAHAGSWGCDVTGDGLVDTVDLQRLSGRLMRKRAVRH